MVVYFCSFSIESCRDGGKGRQRVDDGVGMGGLDSRQTQLRKSRDESSQSKGSRKEPYTVMENKSVDLRWVSSTSVEKLPSLDVELVM
ncbi:predicted protein [Sclerotinia sclerotiorum 1980 UF-70]|uniref:Uncharacterized protein n=1 Tax=Sclerotinia sclerotiorum (strain ATCC 18683 / 1980 / Ss-1) TaxID=665079 RepID=A7F9F1_SCLS1|nr:predicted protein [Sclerotinia sclerotiorum 1980 UF-70]EDO00362.1 predicted protein [Sclerotinia sclerotiorum 1980 UF-70]